jgi:hypothetical protein
VRRIQLQWRKLVLVTLLVLVSARPERAAEPALTKAQIKQFMLTAKVIAAKHTKKGITDPWRLTLSDGTTTHEAVFQSIDEHKSRNQLENGTVELNYVDSYKYNIAGSELAELLGMDDMVPPHVERRWNNMIGSMSWVVPVKMDELDRRNRKISVPASNVNAYNDQMYKVRIFDELIYDTDANLTNVLLTEDWRIWRVDFSRAFRLHKNLKTPKDLVRCDRALLAKLKALNEAELTQRTKNFLTKPEIQGVMARRDKIVAYFQKLIIDKGENEVLY